ncbi:hypothetical protein ACFYRD_18290 [Streptomyces hirsutus]|uniref:hypothetical protein n=1 Tax=Streptomyces hirsutus TaxID=35620 RepID=UPI0036AE4043
MSNPQSVISQLFEREIQEAVDKATGNDQLSREDLARMSHEQINEARRSGRLNDLLFGRK